MLSERSRLSITPFFSTTIYATRTKYLVLSIVRGFCIVQKQKGVADAMIEAGQCGVEVEGGQVPTQDWFLNVQILTSGGFQ